VLVAADRPLVRLSGIGKTYGETHALDDVSMEAHAGEIVGVVGHNGAGKSTLMRILTGVTPADSGVIEIAGEDMGARYSPGKARAHGIRVVYQELSLCPNLRVFENLAVHHPELRSIGWGKTSRRLMAASLEQVFPNHRIPLSARVDTLSIAERQMVEIASAVAPVGAPLRVLVLDEPTSSLDADAANSLFEFLDRKKREGLLCFFISHRLGEILEQTDRVCALRDGRVAATESSRRLSREELISYVGGGAAEAAAESTGRREAKGEGSLYLDVRALSSNRLNDVSINVRAGEIVGIAGLEGQGQRALLQAVFEARNHGRRQRAVQLTVPAAYVSGDRVTEGVFYLWNVGQNITVTGLEKLSRFGIVRSVAERRLIDDWMRLLAISGQASTTIAALSGGNQQKAVVARAMGSQAQLILLDDPMRGVDVGTKREFYNLLRQSLDDKRSFLWYSTENDELCQCDRVYVMREGHVVEELLPEDLTEERIVKASFRDRPAEEAAT
jgi:ribose transport system ATP-binding protein